MKKKYFFRILLIALVLVSGFALLPVEAAAEGTNCTGSHTGWTQLTATTTTLSSGRYYLANNLTTNGTDISVTGDVTLCLNGKKISLNDTFDCISVSGDGYLTLCDCVGTGEIKKADTGSNVRAGIYLSNNGSMTMYGGKIVSESYYAISCSTTGDLYIRGGTINTRSDSIDVSKINDLTVSSGTITSSEGSGISVDEYGGAQVRNITISGGNIEGKTGGLLFREFSCTGKVLISGGTLNGKGPVPNATTYASHYYGLSFMNSNGGACNVTISGGKLDGARGGIYTNDSLVDITVSGGTVGNSKAVGIEANGGDFRIDGGRIYTMRYGGPVNTVMTNGELYGVGGMEGSFRMYGGTLGRVGSQTDTSAITVGSSSPPKENPISIEIHGGTVVGSKYAIEGYGVYKLKISGGTWSGGTADLYLNVYDGKTITRVNDIYR